MASAWAAAELMMARTSPPSVAPPSQGGELCEQKLRQRQQGAGGELGVAQAHAHAHEGGHEPHRDGERGAQQRTLHGGALVASGEDGLDVHLRRHDAHGGGAQTAEGVAPAAREQGEGTGGVQVAAAAGAAGGDAQPYPEQGGFEHAADAGSALPADKDVGGYQQDGQEGGGIGAEPEEGAQQAHAGQHAAGTGEEDAEAGDEADHGLRRAPVAACQILGDGFQPAVAQRFGQKERQQDEPEPHAQGKAPGNHAVLVGELGCADGGSAADGRADNGSRHEPGTRLPPAEAEARRAPLPTALRDARSDDQRERQQQAEPVQRAESQDR